MMIEFVGNYKDAISSSWVEYMSNHTGDIRPGSRMKLNDGNTNQMRDLRNAGYYSEPEQSNATWELFRHSDISEQLDIDKFDFCKNKIVRWWFIKVLPGHLFPVHTDNEFQMGINPKRYWVALEDYHWGHVFVIGNQTLRDYKKGDVYQIENVLHGGANVGSENKYSLQIFITDI